MCDICYGIYANCPVCGEETETETCTLCGGSGKKFFDENGEYLTNEEVDEYNTCGRWVGEEPCPECGGMGEKENP